MSEKPSGIAQHAFIHHMHAFLSLPLSLTLSTAIDVTFAIISITVPATTMLINVKFISMQTSLQGLAVCDKL